MKAAAGLHPAGRRFDPYREYTCSIRIRGGAPGFQPGKESVRSRHAAHTHRNANGGDPDSKSGCGEFDPYPMCNILDWLSGYSICLVNRNSPVRVRDPDHEENKEIMSSLKNYLCSLMEELRSSKSCVQVRVLAEVQYIEKGD